MVFSTVLWFLILSTSLSSCRPLKVPRVSLRYHCSRWSADQNRQLPLIVYPHSSTRSHLSWQADTTRSSSLGLTSSSTCRFNVTFPVHYNLMGYARGQSVASEILSATAMDGSQHQFRVLLYPRGGGHTTNNKPLLGDSKPKKESTGGFGMAYQVLPMFTTPEERLGVYLQYLPNLEGDTVDATFDVQLKGTQSTGRRFDVMWSAGMQFVSVDLQNLANGIASDFGAHLMQTKLLEQFMGADENNIGEPLHIQLRLTLHPRNTNVTLIPENSSAMSALKDIRHTDKARTGKIVVPVLQRLEQRNRMFALGVYPGVEYRIMRIFNEKGDEIFDSCPDCQYELKPIYPLVQQLERQWPIVVQEKEIPKLYTANMYNAISAIGSLLTAVLGLSTAFLLSQAISLFFIPSRSMDPTLQVGDVLLVEKISPRLRQGNSHIGDVILFSPPSRLRDVVAANGGRITDRDLFVKRVAAGPGDVISVNEQGSVVVNGKTQQVDRDLCEAEPLKLIERYIVPGKTTIQSDEVFVRGDCSSVSIDSRVWGPLKINKIVGKPLLRIWPLESFGRVPDLPLLSETDWNQ